MRSGGLAACVLGTGLSLIAAGAAWAQAPAAPTQGGCQLKKIADLKFEERDGEILVPVSVNGVSRLFALGSTGPALAYGETAKLWNLKVQEGGFVADSKGTRPLGAATVASATVGEAFAYSNATVLVDMEKAPKTPDLGGNLGNELLAQVDIEYDLKNGRISLFDSKGCETAPLAYWSQAWAQADFDSKSGRNMIMAKVGGKTVSAVLSPSGRYSFIRAASARNLHVATAAGAPPPEALEPVEDYAATLVTYDGFELGGEAIRNPKIVTIEVSSVLRAPGFAGRATGPSLIARGVADLTLGTDFFHAHRVFISNRQKRIYFTYNGGPVFARPPAASAASQPK